MALQRLTLLGEWTHSGTLAAGSLWQPSAAQGNAEIGVDEAAEVVYFEIESPYNSTGPVIEDLRYVWPVVDGESYQSRLNFPGRDDKNVWPMRERTIADGKKRTVFVLGMGLLDALGQPQPALANTTLKYKRQLTFIAQAGASDVTQDFTIRAYGYLWNQEMLNRLPSQTMSYNFTIVDQLRGRELPVNGPSNIPITADSFDRLPGGRAQDTWAINPFVRFAVNGNATTPNTEYQFRFDNAGNVRSQFEDMYFDMEIRRDILLVDRFGMRDHANQRWSYGRLFGPSDPISEFQPSSRIPMNGTYNPINFGYTDPVLALSARTYAPPQEQFLNGLVIANDRFTVAMQDNGSSIPAGEVTAFLSGTYIQRPER